MIARSGLDRERGRAAISPRCCRSRPRGAIPRSKWPQPNRRNGRSRRCIDLFVGLTKDAPALALLEDAHWIDPTSLDMFGRLIDRLQGLRALLVVTFRPEFAAPWLGRAHVTALSLNRFGRRQAVTMVDRVTGGKALPSEVSEQIVAKTDGVPLFVEELTKTVIESGLHARGERRLRPRRGADAARDPLDVAGTR